MPRRKREFLEDSDDSSSQPDSVGDLNQDEREERALFEDPYKHKKRKGNGKEDAVYGVFGSEDEGTTGARSKPQKKNDWAKAPAFVSGDIMVLDWERESSPRDQEEVDDD